MRNKRYDNSNDDKVEEIARPCIELMATVGYSILEIVRCSKK